MFRYTPKEVEFVRGNHDKMTAKEMASYLECERQKIYNICNKYEVRPKVDPAFRARKPKTEPGSTVNDRSMAKGGANMPRPPAVYDNNGYESVSASMARIEHDLKVWPVFFEAICRGEKNFEARKDDRDFQIGDTLLLKEWEPVNGDYTGRTTRRTISFILPGGKFGVEQGYCIIGLREMDIAPATPRAVTLMQPWASLVVCGLKTFITRATDTGYRGRVLIHAATRKTPEVVTLPDFISTWLLQGGDASTIGAIIGEVTIADTCPAPAIRDAVTDNERTIGDFSEGRFAWKLTNARKYDMPRVCKGPAGLWELNEL